MELGIRLGFGENFGISGWCVQMYTVVFLETRCTVNLISTDRGKRHYLLSKTNSLVLGPT
jgi:hypothetical protein